MPEIYHIRVKGHLDPRWSAWFSDLDLIALEGDQTLITGPLADQAALYGLLKRIRDLNLTLLSVDCDPQFKPQDRKGEHDEES